MAGVGNLLGSPIAKRAARTMDEAAGKIAFKKYTQDILAQPDFNHDKLAVLRLKDK